MIATIVPLIAASYREPPWHHGRGLEGKSKRKDSMYRSGRSPDWLKMKNLDAPAVKREAEEEWGKKKWR